jgi:hypothetical protein
MATAVPTQEQFVGDDGSIWMIFRVPNYSFTYNGENAPAWTGVVTLMTPLPEGQTRNVWYSGGLTRENIMTEPQRWINTFIERHTMPRIQYAA